MALLLNKISEILSLNPIYSWNAQMNSSCQNYDSIILLIAAILIFLSFLFFELKYLNIFQNGWHKVNLWFGFYNILSILGRVWGRVRGCQPRLFGLGDTMSKNPLKMTKISLYKNLFFWVFYHKQCPKIHII